MSLQAKQDTIYKAMMLLDSVGCGISIKGQVRNIVLAHEFWEQSGKLAIGLQRVGELNRAKQALTSMQKAHTVEQAQLQEKINRLQVGE